MDFSSLSDEALVAKIDCLARTERFALTDFLLHLNELDKRDACEHRGYPSVFAYLTKHLGFSESDAIRRVRAARAVRSFPSVLRMIAQGEVHLVGLSLLQPYLTPQNHRYLLRQASGRTQREIERLVAQLAPPTAEPRDRIRALPPSPRTEAVRTQMSVPEPPLFSGTSDLELGAETASAQPKEPAAARHLFTFAAGDRVHVLFVQARDLLRHRFPHGRMEEIIGEALERLVAEELPAPAKRTTGGRRAKSVRRIPSQVKNAVWNRDGGRCSYVGENGVRCGETAWLEYDHKTPWALGGKSDDPENIRLLCRAHNQAAAREYFPHLDKGVPPG